MRLLPTLLVCLFPLITGCDLLSGSNDEEDESSDTSSSGNDDDDDDDDDDGGNDIDDLDNFIDAYAEAACNADVGCDPNTFYDNYESVDQCIDDFEDYLDSDLDGCDYDADAGTACVNALEAYGESCDEDDFDDYEDNCDDVCG